jgi:ABC-type transport system substrate-binding protein
MIRQRKADRLRTVVVSLVAVAALVVSCGETPTSTSTPTPSGPQASGAAIPPTAAPRGFADRIRIGIVSPFERVGGRVGASPFPLSNVIDHGTDMESLPVAGLLFRALYRYDAVLTPVPDLAAEPCSASTDLLLVTCRLGSALFSNGDQLTAADVAFTYDLARSEPCPFGQFSGICLKDSLTSVEVVDPSTVRFTLSHVDPIFVSIGLPTVWIDSKRLVDAQYEAFRTAAIIVGSTRLRAQAETLDVALGTANPDCEALRLAAEPLVVSAGVQLPDKALWKIGPGRTFDTCAWTGLLRDSLFTAADSLDSTGIDAEAIAYSILPLNWHPVGSGLWQIDEAATKLGERVVLSTSPVADHQPATAHFEFVSYPTRRDAAEGFRLGEIDWLHIPADFGGGVEQGGADLYHVVQGMSDVKFAEYADPTGLMELDFNMRKGQLFSDVNLRQALALCIDKRPLVDAASDGQGTQAATVIAADFWPANPELAVAKRDVPAARRLIESSGWKLSKGVYERNGKRLSAEIWVASERPERVKFASLLAYQVGDCGMKISVSTASTSDLNPVIFSWPHFPPGRKQPFDMLMAFGFGPLDPDPYLHYFETANASSAENKYGNVNGYGNPAFDRLIEQARTSYDTAKRARFYRDAQGILAQDLPLMPVWYRLERVALRSGMTTASGSPLDLDKPGWAWRPDELVLTTGQ